MPEPQKKLRHHPYVPMRMSPGIASNVDSLKAAVKERDSLQQHMNQMHDTVDDVMEATKKEQSTKKGQRLRKYLKGK